MPPSAGPRRLRVDDVSPTAPWVGVELHDVVDSTNAEASRRAVPWLAVVSEAQLQGRGRLDRGWTTTPGRSLAVSAVLPAPALPGWVPLVTGLALRRAISDSCGVEAVLKWPNDVLCPADGDRKLAGILCEWAPVGIIVGCGVNVAQQREELPVDTATSLALCGAGEVSRERLLTAYLSHLARLHAALDGGPATERVWADYRAACATLGRTVVVHLPDGATRRGRAVAVDDDGRLVVDTPAGEYAASAGDVVHVRTDGVADGPPQDRAKEGP